MHRCRPGVHPQSPPVTTEYQMNIPYPLPLLGPVLLRGIVKLDGDGRSTSNQITPRRCQLELGAGRCILASFPNLPKYSLLQDWDARALCWGRIGRRGSSFKVWRAISMQTLTSKLRPRNSNYSQTKSVFRIDEDHGFSVQITAPNAKSVLPPYFLTMKKVI